MGVAGAGFGVHVNGGFEGEGPKGSGRLCCDLDSPGDLKSQQARGLLERLTHSPSLPPLT